MKKQNEFSQKMIILLGCFLMACGGRNIQPSKQQNPTKGPAHSLPPSAQTNLQQPSRKAVVPTNEVVSNGTKSEGPAITEKSVVPVPSPPVTPERPVVVNPSVPPKIEGHFVKTMLLDKQKHLIFNLKLENPSEEPLWFLFPAQIPFLVPKNNDAVTDISVFAPAIENQPERILVFGEFSGDHEFRAILLPARATVFLQNVTIPWEQQNSDNVNFEVLVTPEFFIRAEEQKTLKSLFSPYPTTTLSPGEKVQVNLEIRGGNDMPLARALPAGSENRILIFSGEPLSIPVRFPISK